MSSTSPISPRPPGAAQPLVAVVCSVPMIFEALRETLAAFADVQVFPARAGTAGLLRSIRPAAVVVDNDEDRGDAEAVARELDFSLVHLALAERRVCVFRDGAWSVASEEDEVRAETVRDAIAAGLFAKGHAR